MDIKVRGGSTVGDTMNGSPTLSLTLASAILLAASLLIFPTPTRAAGQSVPADLPAPTLDQILQRFDDSVYFKPPGNGTPVLAKWLEDIRVGFASDPGVPVAVASKLFDGLSATADLSRHRIVVTNQNVNFFVLFSNNLDADLKKYGPAFRRYFSSDAEFESYYAQFKATKAACNVRVTLYGNYTIRGVAAIVMVPAGDLTPAERCIYNVVFIGMGFIGRSGHLKAPPKSAESTTIDASVLAILYRNEISSGSTKDQDRPIITKIVRAARHE